MPELKTPQEWLSTPEFSGVRILDCDGWRRDEWHTPIVVEEMHRRLALCTQVHLAGSRDAHEVIAEFGDSLPEQERAAFAAEVEEAGARRSLPHKSSSPAAAGSKILPRRWEIPAEPGPEVTAVRAALGVLYHRDGEYWTRVPGLTTRYRWPTLVFRRGPLTDATAELAASEVGDGDVD